MINHGKCDSIIIRFDFKFIFLSHKKVLHIIRINTFISEQIYSIKTENVFWFIRNIWIIHILPTHRSFSFIKYSLIGNLKYKYFDIKSQSIWLELAYKKSRLLLLWTVFDEIEISIFR